jgi:hypothetical protein
MELVAKYHGFTIRLDKEYIKCNRQGTDKTKRACLNGPLSAGCTFKFKLASLETERYMPEDFTKKKWRDRKRWDGPIKIIEGCGTHGSACQPNKQNSVNTSQRAHKYMNNMPKSAIFTLCNYIENLGRLDSNLITNVMKPVWPRAKALTKHDIFNIHTLTLCHCTPSFFHSDILWRFYPSFVGASDMSQGYLKGTLAPLTHLGPISRPGGYKT